MISDKQFNTLAQYNHVMFGMLAVFIPVTLFGYKSVLLYVFIATAYAAIKEFWWDNKYESAEVKGSNLEDFTFYFLGTIIALVIVCLKQ